MKQRIFKDDKIKERIHIIEGKDKDNENERIDVFGKTLKQTTELAKRLGLTYVRIWEAKITRYETIEVGKLVKRLSKRANTNL